MLRIPIRSFSLLIQFSVFWVLQSCADTSPAFRSRWETQDGIPVVIDSIYYAISGSTLEELQVEMERLGPKDGTIQRYATTEYDIRWTYRFRPKGQRCTLGQIEVGARFLVRLPLWSPQKTVTPQTREKWKTFITSLHIHEAGHRDLALRAAGTILRKLRAMPGQMSCSDLDAAATYAGRTILQEFQKLQQEYDERTKHGLTQGVQLL
ncbi:MAG: DUF922 domain-containing protein [Ignavibacteriales bacterium]|nr:DUF922 domain-containing protein [Ignavibacteriales bacterium]